VFIVSSVNQMLSVSVIVRPGLCLIVLPTSKSWYVRPDAP
jgi:hypothetical protein